jgi:hypothetical protein
VKLLAGVFAGEGLLIPRALMRFLLRSAFWLGLTFHAMPWDGAQLASVAPDPRAAIASLTAEDHDGAAAKAVVGAVLRGAFDSATTPDPAPARAISSAKPTRPSVDTLTAADRLPSWRGFALRSTI